MAIAGYTTEVTVAKSSDAVTKLLVKAGATDISTQWDAGVLVGLSFGIQTEFGFLQFQLPVRVEGVQVTLKRDRVPPRYQTREHAARVAWRIAHDWLRAQLALIDAGMSTLPEILFPYALVAPRTTAFERYVSSQREIESAPY